MPIRREAHCEDTDDLLVGPILDAILFAGRDDEGLAHHLMGECLAAEEPVTAEDHAETAMRILERCGAQNDFAKALATRGELCRLAGDLRMAREPLTRAKEIFLTLGTRTEAARVDTALAALDRDERIAQLAGAS